MASVDVSELTREQLQARLELARLALVLIGTAAFGAYVLVLGSKGGP